jgi:hypothetical protein
VNRIEDIEFRPMTGDDVDTQRRIFESDLTSIERDVSFNGNGYPMHMHLTAFGGSTVQAIDWIALLTENTVSKRSDHFRKLVDRCDELYHGHKKLRDHIEVFSFHCLIFSP